MRLHVLSLLLNADEAVQFENIFSDNALNVLYWRLRCQQSACRMSMGFGDRFDGPDLTPPTNTLRYASAHATLISITMSLLLPFN